MTKRIYTSNEIMYLTVRFTMRTSQSPNISIVYFRPNVVRLKVL